MTTIVVVDDDQGILDALTYILEDEGYRVVSASNGDGLEYLLHKEQPSLLIMDVLLPGIHGHLLGMWVRKHKDFSHIPIILMSASHVARKTALQVGLKYFLEKPFDIDDLLALVHQLCK